MNPMLFGIIAGVVFGAVDMALMLTMDFPDKRTALLGAFLSRFAIGVLIPLVELPMSGWAIGAVVGLLISLPDAVITKFVCANFDDRPHRWRGHWLGGGSLGGLASLFLGL